MDAVKKAAGAEPVGEAEKCLAAGMRAALATRNIQGPDAEAFMVIVEQFYLRIKAGGGSLATDPVQVAGTSSAPAGQQGGGLSLSQRLAAERGVRTGRGRSPARQTPARQTPVPRSSSTSRSPKGRQEEY